MLLSAAAADACVLMGLLICLHLETPWGPLSERHVHVLMPPVSGKASEYDPKNGFIILLENLIRGGK